MPDHHDSTPTRSDVGGNIFATQMFGVGTGPITAIDGKPTVVSSNFAETVTA